MKQGTAISFSIFVVLVLVMAIILMATSIKKLETNEQAIMCRYEAHARQNVAGPLCGFLTYSAVYSTVELNLVCLTQDGLPVNMTVTFQYVPSSNDLLEISMKFRDADKYQDVVTIAAKAAVVDACTEYNISNYQSGRPVIQSRIDDIIKANLKVLKADALAAQLVEVTVPAAWNTATSDKQRAAQDIGFALNERAQSVAQAANNVSLAQQDALITNQTATTNVNIALTAAHQNAAAVTAEYEAFGNVLVDMVQTYKLDFAGLMSFLENSLIRGSSSVDLVLQHASI